MPLKSYGVLKGRAKAKRVSDRGHPHYHLWITANGHDYRAAVNVRSMLHPSEMEYLIALRFHHPITDELSVLAPGFHPLERTSGGLALDFIRLNLFDRDHFLTLPCDGPGCGADLNEVLDGVICAAIADPQCFVYVYGEAWATAQATDRFFRFFPSRGMHEIHMNQGNDPSHWEQDGTWQDGAILIEHPGQRRWTGIFLKFQSQSWHTDDDSGHPLAPPEAFDESAPFPLNRNGMPRPDGMVRIVAAMVRPRCGPPGERESPKHSKHSGNPGRAGHSGPHSGNRSGEGESVTLLNVCPFPVDLTGWTLANRAKRRWRLRGMLAPGEVREIPLGASVPLGNHGGIITLLNREGLKVHGVSYTAEQACHEGWRIVFG